MSNVYKFFIGLTIVWWVLTALFHPYDPFRSYLYWWNVNPVLMIALNMVFLGGGIALSKSAGSDFNAFDGLCTVVAVLGVVVMGYNWATYGYGVMSGLREETYYKPESAPLDITEFRVSSYAEASANFNTQNPDARFQVGNLNFIQGRWTAEYGPKGFWNAFNLPTQGFFEYDPTKSPNATYVPNSMPFAENGILGNNLSVLIGQRDPFAYYDKALWVPDTENPGHYMIVVSLSKRRGLNAVPYVSNVVLFHQDGRQEWLSPDQASADPRLVGIQIIPEWLEKLRASAYNYPLSWWTAVAVHTDQLQVQVSSVDSENTPPYHMKSGNTMYWVTPLSPYNTPSFKALAWQQSNDINGPLHVWSVPGDKAYSGVDALAAKIKTTDGHPSNVKWLINNNGTLSGEEEIIEMLPISHNGKPYFVGYTALGSNPQKTRMYVTIRAEDGAVMKDQFSIAEVDNWLQSKSDLTLLVKTESQTTAPTSSLDLSKMSVQQLWDLLNRIINELQKREGSSTGSLILPNQTVTYEGGADLYGLAWKTLGELINKSI